MLTYSEQLINTNNPFIVLVEGDTNAVLATALAAIKNNAEVGHVEAGLRSHDLRMPEEHNRRLTDHISTQLFAPTETAKNNLKSENVWGQIHIMPIAPKTSRIMEHIKFNEFALATAHKAENVDNA